MADYIDTIKSLLIDLFRKELTEEEMNSVYTGVCIKAYLPAAEKEKLRCMEGYDLFECCECRCFVPFPEAEK